MSTLLTNFPSADSAPALVVDLDHTIRHPRSGEYIDDPSDIAFYDGVLPALKRYREAGVLVLGLTNQGGVAYGHKTEQDLREEMQVMRRLAGAAGLEEFPMDAIYAEPVMAGGSREGYDHESLGRKPRYGGLAILEHELRGRGAMPEWTRSLMVGDREEDQTCAQEAGLDFMGAVEWRRQATDAFQPDPLLGDL